LEDYLESKEVGFPIAPLGQGGFYINKQKNIMNTARPSNVCRGEGKKNNKFTEVAL